MYRYHSRRHPSAGVLHFSCSRRSKRRSEKVRAIDRLAIPPWPDVFISLVQNDGSSQEIFLDSKTWRNAHWGLPKISLSCNIVGDGVSAAMCITWSVALTVTLPSEREMDSRSLTYRSNRTSERLWWSGGCWNQNSVTEFQSVSRTGLFSKDSLLKTDFTNSLSMHTVTIR